MNRSIWFLAALALPLSAGAVPGPNPAGYAGDYALTCEGAALGLTLGIAVNGPTVNDGFSRDISAQLPCEASPAAYDAWIDSLEGQCIQSGLPARACRDAADEIHASLLPLTSVGENLMPQQMSWSVDATNPFGQLTGLYSVLGRHTWADGRTTAWNYALDDNLGATRGDFLSLGVALAGEPLGDGACLGSQVAAVQGNIDADAGYTLEGGFFWDVRLTCLVPLPADHLLTVSISVDLAGELSGAAVP